MGEQAGEARERRVRLTIKGRVQGVGYRYFTAQMARDLGLAGWVANRPNGDVEAVLSGPVERVAAAIEQLRRGPLFARVDEIEVADQPVSDETPAAAPSNFEIRGR